MNKYVGIRLDKAVLDMHPEISRSHIKTLIQNGDILVNNTKQKAGYIIRNNDEITVQIPKVKPLEVKAENISLDIVYEDNDLAIINKPQGMVVHPANGNENGTLVNALLYNIKDLSGINGVIRPGIVHRLDKDTSGLLIIAKNDLAHKNLAKQIETKQCKRIYHAIVHNAPKEDVGEIITNYGRHPTDRKKMAVLESSNRVAHTKYTVLERLGQFTYMEFELKTGRTHQIRVHCAYMGIPIVGDKTYGVKEKFKFEGQLLHAKKIEFTHPSTGEYMSFEVELPDYFEKFLNLLRLKVQ